MTHLLNFTLNCLYNLPILLDYGDGASCAIFDSGFGILMVVLLSFMLIGAMTVPAVIVPIIVMRNRKQNQPLANQAPIANDNQNLEQYNTTQPTDTEKLREYKKLLDEGIITQEEFENKKKRILSCSE